MYSAIRPGTLPVDARRDKKGSRIRGVRPPPHFSRRSDPSPQIAIPGAWRDYARGHGEPSDSVIAPPSRDASRPPRGANGRDSSSGEVASQPPQARRVAPGGRSSSGRRSHWRAYQTPREGCVRPPARTPDRRAWGPRRGRRRDGWRSGVVGIGARGGSSEVGTREPGRIARVTGRVGRRGRGRPSLIATLGIDRQNVQRRCPESSRRGEESPEPLMPHRPWPARWSRGEVDRTRQGQPGAGRSRASSNPRGAGRPGRRTGTSLAHRSNSSRSATQSASIARRDSQTSSCLPGSSWW